MSTSPKGKTGWNQGGEIEIRVRDMSRSQFEELRAHALQHGVSDSRTAIMKWAAAQHLRSLQDDIGD